MAIKPLITLFVIGNACLAQNQKPGVVLYGATKQPVEFVDVFSDYNNTFTYTEGTYFMLTHGDSLTFQKNRIYQKGNPLFRA